MSESVERTTRGLLRSRWTWVMLLAGPVALAGVWSINQLTATLPASAACGETPQQLCAPGEVLSAGWLAFLAALLAGLVVALTVVWAAWVSALPMTVMG